MHILGGASVVNQEEINQKLREHGLKLTNQRKAIIDVLFESIHHFLSAEEIYLKSKEKYSKTNFSTIYRNLEILEQIGMVHKTNVNGNSYSYGIVCQHEHHHHIICRACGKTQSISFCPLEKILPQIDQYNFTLTDHKFELYGYCESCQKKIDKKNK